MQYSAILSALFGRQILGTTWISMPRGSGSVEWEPDSQRTNASLCKGEERERIVCVCEWVHNKECKGEALCVCVSSMIIKLPSLKNFDRKIWKLDVRFHISFDNDKETATK